MHLQQSPFELQASIWTSWVCYVIYFKYAPKAENSYNKFHETAIKITGGHGDRGAGKQTKRNTAV